MAHENSAVTTSPTQGTSRRSDPSRTGDSCPARGTRCRAAAGATAAPACRRAGVRRSRIGHHDGQSSRTAGKTRSDLASVGCGCRVGLDQRGVRSPSAAGRRPTVKPAPTDASSTRSPFFSRAGTDGVVQRQRNRGRGGVAEPLDVDDRPCRVDAELLRRRLDDAAVGLVRDEQVEVVRR